MFSLINLDKICSVTPACYKDSYVLCDNNFYVKHKVKISFDLKEDFYNA